MRLLTNLEIETLDDAIKVFGIYIERWRKEEGYRFTKSFLNLEDIRVQNFEAIANLSFLVQVTYFFISLYFRAAPKAILDYAEKRLKHFKPMHKIRFRYYRVGQVLRSVLCEQRTIRYEALAFTEVG